MVLICQGRKKICMLYIIRRSLRPLVFWVHVLLQLPLHAMGFGKVNSFSHTCEAPAMGEVYIRLVAVCHLSLRIPSPGFASVTYACVATTLAA